MTLSMFPTLRRFSHDVGITRWLASSKPYVLVVGGGRGMATAWAAFVDRFS